MYDSTEREEKVENGGGGGTYNVAARISVVVEGAPVNASVHGTSDASRPVHRVHPVHRVGGARATLVTPA